MLVSNLKPPYYAVIFSTILNTESDATNSTIPADYQTTAERMMQLAAQQDGFLGVESARADIGITVSYWRDLAAIQQWKNNSQHQWAKQQGKANWYQDYRVRIAKVEHDYDF